MNSRFFAALLALTCTLSLVACGQEEVVEETPEVELVVPEPEPTPEPEPEPEPEPVARNPLTGLAMDEAYLLNRPIAIMHNNHINAMPQVGVSQADIIYEIPAEGGITRMLGVYQSVADVGDLGSIRSARTYYIELAMGHDALYVHAGGSPQAYENIKSWDIDNMDGVNGGSDASIFWRDSVRRETMDYEHTMLTSGANILEYLETGRYESVREETVPSGLVFAEEVTLDGETATDVTVQMSSYKNTYFSYNAESDTYDIAQYNSPYIDGNDGETVSVTNVLVLQTPISVIAGDTEGRLNVVTVGTGSGYYFCSGEAIAIGWEKTARDQPLTYTTADGEPLTLERGHSYVCIIDDDNSVNYQ